LASTKARQHLLPQLRSYQSGKDLFAGALAQAKILDFIAKVFF
jgi:hypothetical protein